MLKELAKNYLPKSTVNFLRRGKLRVDPIELRRAKRIGMTPMQLKKFLADPEGAVHLDKLYLFGTFKKVSFLKESKVFLIESILEDAYQLESFDLPRDKHITMVDIGANVGAFAMAARTEFLNATIHCYEPLPIIEKYLRVQAFAVQAKYFMEGVGNKEGSFSLDRRQNDTLDAVSVAIMDFTKSGDIKITSLKKVLERIGGEIDILKLDCEGSEWVILQDLESLKKVKYITFEYHRICLDESFDVYDRSCDIQKKAIDQLTKAGFEIKHIRPHSVDNGIILAKRRT